MSLFHFCNYLISLIRCKIHRLEELAEQLEALKAEGASTVESASAAGRKAAAKTCSERVQRLRMRYGSGSLSTSNHLLAQTWLS